jgi:hypothetical protein
MSAHTNTPVELGRSKGIALIAAYREGRSRLMGAGPGSIRPSDPAEGPRGPSLAEVGFRRGMSIRLGQLGLHNIGRRTRPGCAWRLGTSAG